MERRTNDEVGRRLRMQAPAKVNLTLEVLGRRDDGYHEIRTIMQTVSLYDDLDISLRTDGKVMLAAEAVGLPEPEENLIVRAARLLKERTGCRLGADISLRKEIPIGAGLGGGSSDCAATLMGLNSLWGLGLAPQELANVAARLGSDVPFFISGGAALCEGRGERVSPLRVGGVFQYVLVMPGFGISTAEVYEALEQHLTRGRERSTMNKVIIALETGDAALLSEAVFNSLQGTAFRLTPALGRLWRALESVAHRPGRLAFVMSGSGSAILGLCKVSDAAQCAAVELAEELSVPVRAVHSLPPVRPGA